MNSWIFRNLETRTPASDAKFRLEDSNDCPFEIVMANLYAFVCEPDHQDLTEREIIDDSLCDKVDPAIFGVASRGARCSANLSFFPNMYV